MIEQIFLVCGLFAIVIITISYIIGNLIEILFMRIKYGIDKKHNNNIKPSISISYNGDNIVDDKRDETEKRRKRLVRLIRKIFRRKK